MMATFALVRFKTSGAVDAVPVDDIRYVVKGNGVKCFVPYEPADKADFVVSKKYKYVVHLQDDDGTIRRWYAMIGRLGASADEVLDPKVPARWPEARSVIEPADTTEPINAPDKEYDFDQMDIDKDDCDQMATANVEQNKDASPESPVQIKQDGAHTQKMQQSQTSTESEILKTLREANGMIRQQKLLQYAREEQIVKLIEDIAEKFERVCHSLHTRLVTLEKKVLDVEELVYKGAHVFEWLKNTSEVQELMSDFTFEDKAKSPEKVVCKPNASSDISQDISEGKPVGNSKVSGDKPVENQHVVTLEGNSAISEEYFSVGE